MSDFLPDQRSGYDGGSLDAAQFSDAIDRLDVPWKVSGTSAGFRGQVRRRKVADCILGEMAFDPCTGERNSSDVRRDMDNFICVSHQREGRLTFSQGGAPIEIGRGDLLLWDGMTPSSFTASGNGRFELLWLPTGLVERRIGPLHGALGQRASCSDGVALMLARHLHDLHLMVDDLSMSAQRRVIEATVDLIFACFESEPVPDKSLTRYQREILVAARCEITERLEEGHVSPASVADKLGISLRYLQKIFSLSGETFSSCVARERLELARRLLADDRHRRLTVTEIAHIAGFCDLSHLSRMFRQRFGLSPARYRELN